MASAKDRSLISPNDVPECYGNPPKGACGKKADPAIKGYDDKFRCIRCNDIHVELVWNEAGEEGPLSKSGPRFVAPKLDARAEKARADVEKLYGPGRADTPVSFDFAGMGQDPEKTRAKIEAFENRRAAIRGTSALVEVQRPSQSVKDRVLAKFGIKT